MSIIPKILIRIIIQEKDTLQLAQLCIHIFIYYYIIYIELHINSKINLLYYCPFIMIFF